MPGRDRPGGCDRSADRVGPGGRHRQADQFLQRPTRPDSDRRTAAALCLAHGRGRRCLSFSAGQRRRGRVADPPTLQAPRRMIVREFSRLFRRSGRLRLPPGGRTIESLCWVSAENLTDGPCPRMRANDRPRWRRPKTPGVFGGADGCSLGRQTLSTICSSDDQSHASACH